MAISEITKGINIYNAWNWDGPKKRAENPEGAALFQVAEQYSPDVSLDAHGTGRRFSMWESTAFSWGDFNAHGFVPAVVEEINRAAGAKGFLIMRPEEDSGRIKVSARVSRLGHHFYYVRDDLTVMSILYNRYHTPALNCEGGYQGSIVARLRRLLELGTDRWRPNSLLDTQSINLGLGAA